MAASIDAAIRKLLRRAILDDEFVAGAQLRQEKLTDRFGTSRIPGREALRQIESEGLVALLSNKGAVVATHIESDFEYAQRILETYEADPEADELEVPRVPVRSLQPSSPSCVHRIQLRPRRTLRPNAGLAGVRQVGAAEGALRASRSCRAHETERAVRLLEDHFVPTKRMMSAAVRRTRIALGR